MKNGVNGCKIIIRNKFPKIKRSNNYGSHLTQEQRYTIYEKKQEGFYQKEIAILVNISPATIRVETKIGWFSINYVKVLIM